MLTYNSARILMYRHLYAIMKCSKIQPPPLYITMHLLINQFWGMKLSTVEKSVTPIYTKFYRKVKISRKNNPLRHYTMKPTICVFILPSFSLGLIEDATTKRGSSHIGCKLRKIGRNILSLCTITFTLTLCLQVSLTHAFCSFWNLHRW